MQDCAKTEANFRCSACKVVYHSLRIIALIVRRSKFCSHYNLTNEANALALVWFGFVSDTSYFERFDIFPFPFLFFHFNGRSIDEGLGKWLILSQSSNFQWLKDKFLSSTNVPGRFSDAATKINSKTFDNAKIPHWSCNIVNTLVVLSKKLPHCRFETVLKFK